MKLPTIPPGLAGKIVKYRPLSEPTRLQDLEDSARSQAWKNIKYVLAHVNEIPSRKRVLSGAPCTTYNWVRRQVTVNRPWSNSKSCQRFIQVSLPAMRNFSWLVTRYPPIFYCVTGQNNVFKGSLKSVASPRKKPLNTSGRYSLDFNKDKSMRQV